MTQRERQILKWIEENPLISQQELADKAGITRSSVAVHISNLMKQGHIAGKGYIVRTSPYAVVVGGVTAVEHTRTERDDRCGLYLQVLEDLWAVDPGLNTDLEELGVDFSGLTDLTESEKSALAWVFGNAHGLIPITGTLEEIWEAGYLTPMTEPAEGYEDSVALYGWEGGCLFSLSGSAEGGFTAQKWASGLGAYIFSDCTAVQNADGAWSYEVGAEAIA